MEKRLLYVVRGTAKNGTVTYNCPTPEWAVRKNRDLIQSGLASITITGPDGNDLSLVELEALADERAIPKARALASRA